MLTKFAINDEVYFIDDKNKFDEQKNLILTNKLDELKFIPYIYKGKIKNILIKEDKILYTIESFEIGYEANKIYYHGNIDENYISFNEHDLYVILIKDVTDFFKNKVEELKKNITKLEVLQKHI